MNESHRDGNKTLLAGKVSFVLLLLLAASYVLPPLVSALGVALFLVNARRPLTRLHGAVLAISGNSQALNRPNLKKPSARRPDLLPPV